MVMIIWAKATIIIDGTMAFARQTKKSGTERTTASATLMMDMRAKPPRWRVPLRMASSPPMMAVMATTGERRRKCSVCLPQPKVYLLSKGLSKAHASMPNKAVMALHALTVCTVWLVVCSSSWA